MADIYVLQTTNNYKYIFRLVQTLDPKSLKPVLSLELPGTSAENSLQMQYEGEKKEYAISWLVYNNNVDTADGTYTSTVKTIEEQIAYVDQQIKKPDLGVGWKLYGDIFSGSGTPVAFEYLFFKVDARKPMYAIGTARFKVGTVV